MVQQRYKPELSLVMLASVADKCGMQVSVRGARSATASPISAAVPAVSRWACLAPLLATPALLALHSQNTRPGAYHDHDLDV